MNITQTGTYQLNIMIFYYIIHPFKRHLERIMECICHDKFLTLPILLQQIDFLSYFIAELILYMLIPFAIRNKSICQYRLLLSFPVKRFRKRREREKHVIVQLCLFHDISLLESSKAPNITYHITCLNASTNTEKCIHLYWKKKFLMYNLVYS